MSDTRQIYSNSLRLAIAVAISHSQFQAEAGEENHLHGHGDLEGTSRLQGFTACKGKQYFKKKYKYVI